MTHNAKYPRRRFFGAASLALAAARFGVFPSAAAPRDEQDPGLSRAFGSLKQLDAGLLNVGYAEAGPLTVLR